MMPGLNIKVRERFEKHFMPVTESGCWLWMGYERPDQYGEFRIERKHQLTHRVSYELYRGSIPRHLQIDHLCRVRQCVNPEHLELVTQRVNILRGNGASAKNPMKTQCPYGHVYDEANTNLQFYRGRVKRRCRNCHRQKERVRYQRKIQKRAKYATA